MGRLCLGLSFDWGSGRVRLPNLTIVFRTSTLRSINRVAMDKDVPTCPMVEVLPRHMSCLTRIPAIGGCSAGSIHLLFGHQLLRKRVAIFGSKAYNNTDTDIKLVYGGRGQAIATITRASPDSHSPSEHIKNHWIWFQGQDLDSLLTNDMMFVLAPSDLEGLSPGIGWITFCVALRPQQRRC